MKALLLADFYQAKKNGRAIVLIVLVFSAITLFGSGTVSASLFFPLYAMLLSGLISMNLLAFDEQSHWVVYAQILPCTRRDQVTVKYLDALMGVGCAWLLLTAIFVVMASRGSCIWDDVPILSSVLLAIGLIPSAILLPVVFRYGVTKGRIVYYIVLIAVAGSSGGLMAVVGDSPTFPMLPAAPSWLVALLPVLIAAALFALSWRLAIRWYEKREL